jgi:hypothetical protein
MMKNYYNLHRILYLLQKLKNIYQNDFCTFHLMTYRSKFYKSDM